MSTLTNMHRQRGIEIHNSVLGRPIFEELGVSFTFYTKEDHVES
jgi:hypothetical protein